jgi:hypothetical protein
MGFPSRGRRGHGSALFRNQGGARAKANEVSIDQIDLQPLDGTW